MCPAPPCIPLVNITSILHYPLYNSSVQQKDELCYIVPALPQPRRHHPRPGELGHVLPDLDAHTQRLTITLLMHLHPGSLASIGYLTRWHPLGCFIPIEAALLKICQGRTGYLNLQERRKPRAHRQAAVLLVALAQLTLRGSRLNMVHHSLREPVLVVQEKRNA